MKIRRSIYEHFHWLQSFLMSVTIISIVSVNSSAHGIDANSEIDTRTVSLDTSKDSTLSFGISPYLDGIVFNSNRVGKEDLWMGSDYSGYLQKLSSTETSKHSSTSDNVQLIKSIAGEVNAPEECRYGVLSVLSLVYPWQGDVELGNVQCLEIRLQKGEFVRAVVEMDTSGIEDLAMFDIEIYAPGDAGLIQSSHVSTATHTRQNVSWGAAAEGSYHLLLRNFYVWPENLSKLPARVWIQSLESPDQVKARSEALVRDPRVDWLRENSNPIRSISPEDTDFTDLEQLHENLDGVRVVLLGEAGHNAGTDFLARSRLVKFLHHEMDFDVLAFEAPLHGMAVAWDSVRAGAPVRDALRLGLWGFWSHAEQMQPLVNYIGEQAAGERPLEVAGFDYRPWIDPWTRNTPAQFAEDLVDFLRREGLQSPLADPESPEYDILKVLAGQRNFEEQPGQQQQALFLQAINETVVRLESLTEMEGRFWAEALRGLGCFVRDQAGFGEGAEPDCFRDYQMGKHLLWLINERYSDRKIIVWAATAHIMRDPEYMHAGSGTGPAMGKLLWDEIGEESYAIGMTSYAGMEGDIVTDQHHLSEFEQLMEAAGFDYAFVNLRKAAREGSWLSGSFPARPRGHHTEVRRWSDFLDAFLFVREQEPSRQVED